MRTWTVSVNEHTWLFKAEYALQALREGFLLSSEAGAKEIVYASVREAGSGALAEAVSEEAVRYPADYFAARTLQVEEVKL